MSPAFLDSSEFSDIAENHVSEKRAAGVPREDGPASAVESPSRRVLGAALAVGTLAMAAVMWWVIGHRSWFKLAPADNLISTTFQGSPGTVQVIVSDEALVLVQVLSGRRATLSQYENLSYLSMPELVERKGLQNFWDSLSTRQITNLGDLQNATRIAENLRAHKWNVSIRHARQINARDLRTGNFIILGSSFSNPWAALFQIKDANFPIEPAPPGKSATILNRHPLAGEPSSFEVQLDAKTGKATTYASVSVLENTAHTARVVLVAGLSMSATEMAGEFRLQNDSVPITRRALGLPPGSPLPDFEMVLGITELNEIGNSVGFVACRKITDRSQ
jgi:hypothetical protein